MTNAIPVDGSWEITGIPIGTRFRVVETPAADSSLKSVTCDATDAKYDVDNGVRGTVTSEAQVTATFTNTAHQLMDIEVEKQWKDAKDKPLTDKLPDIWVKLERRHVNDTTGEWVDATSAVKLQYNYMTGKWTHKFERLDKTDVSSGTKYEYRVAECATAKRHIYGKRYGYAWHIHLHRIADRPYRWQNHPDQPAHQPEILP